MLVFLKKPRKTTAKIRFYHVVSSDKRIINSDKFHVISSKSNSCNQTTDPSKSYPHFILFNV